MSRGRTQILSISKIVFPRGTAEESKGRGRSGEGGGGGEGGEGGGKQRQFEVAAHYRRLSSSNGLNQVTREAETTRTLAQALIESA